ncbi:unnamed protein product [Hydatigera taeniaeformis]|uniref:CARMIL_C domain-containing protein n=1 Tax=Hydatigena taeniaeformis TaxID=6205 RepID=A0A0R3WM43_HYDTA|nr:unnamed protein product [Hydatigera taeniaeformis]
MFWRGLLTKIFFSNFPNPIQLEREEVQSQASVGKSTGQTSRKPTSDTNSASCVEGVAQKAVCDLDEVSNTEDSNYQLEAKRANLSTFEHFVNENNLDLRRKANQEVPETGGRTIVEDIVAVLGSEAKRPMRRCRRSAILARQALLLHATNEGGDGGEDSDEDPDKVLLAGSMDVMRNQATVTLSPLLNTSTTPLVSSQEDLLQDENLIEDNELSVSKQSNNGAKEELVLNRCPVVQDSRTPLESIQSFHPGPASVDAAGLLKVVSPPRTPPAALVEVLSDKTPGVTVCQLSIESPLESPERARRTAVAFEDKTSTIPLPIVIPKASPPQIEEDFKPKIGDDVNLMGRKSGPLCAVPSVDLDDSKSSAQQLSPPTKRVSCPFSSPTFTSKTKSIDADAFLSPIQPPPSSTRRSRQSRASTANSTTITTLTTDVDSTLEDSQTVNRSAPSPMVMSPFQRLEAVVNAMESQENGASKLRDSPTNLKKSKRLWDTTATYLADESPCPNAVGVLTPDNKPPPPGGLIVPALGNKFFNISAKTRGDKKSLDKETSSKRKSMKGCASPSRGRRFFASTFAERNKREIEKRFFEVIQRKATSETSKKEKRLDDGQQRRKSLSKKKERGDADRLDLQLCQLIFSPWCSLPRIYFIALSLEGSGGVEKGKGESFRPPKDPSGTGADDESGCRLQSRPAIRRAAAIARNRIMETSLNELDYSDHSVVGSALPSPIPVSRKAAKVEVGTTGSSLDTSRRSALGLFAPTPNTSGVYDFTLSEDDELVKGLPRLKGKNKSVVKRPKGMLKRAVSLLTATPEHSSQPIISASFLTDMNRCVGIVFSTLNIVESEFAHRLNQLRDQVREMQRLLRWWQQRHPREEEGKREEDSVDV